MGGGFRREKAFIYLWLIPVDVWQKSTQYCKVIILQLKKKKEWISESSSFGFLYSIHAIILFYYKDTNEIFAL